MQVVRIGIKNILRSRLTTNLFEILLAMSPNVRTKSSGYRSKRSSSDLTANVTAGTTTDRSGITGVITLVPCYEIVV